MSGADGDDPAVRSLGASEPRVVPDGSIIRDLLGTATAPVRHHSLAEATIPAGEATQRHRHLEREEIYFLLEGSGEIEIAGRSRPVAAGDAILIPQGSRHSIRAARGADVRLLVSCAPPFSQDDVHFD